MRNIFSKEETAPQLHEAFSQEQPPNRPIAPLCKPIMPAPAPVPLRTPDFEALARRSAPGHAASNELTYRWRD